MSYGSYVASDISSHSSQMSSEGRWENFELEAGHERLEQLTYDNWACHPIESLPVTSPPFNHLFEDLQICPTTTPALSRRTTRFTDHSAHLTAQVRAHKPQKCPSVSTPLARYVNTDDNSVTHAESLSSCCHMQAQRSVVLNPLIRGPSICWSDCLPCIVPQRCRRRIALPKRGIRRRPIRCCCRQRNYPVQEQLWGTCGLFNHDRLHTTIGRTVSI